jgi:hypothetical protein
MESKLHEQQQRQKLLNVKHLALEKEETEEKLRMKRETERNF